MKIYTANSSSAFEKRKKKTKKKRKNKKNRSTQLENIFKRLQIIPITIVTYENIFLWLIIEIIEKNFCIHSFFFVEKLRVEDKNTWKNINATFSSECDL